jgi:hypothetical protein
MACGCGSTPAGELWRAYLPDGTVTEPMSKPQATQEAARSGGYILQVGAEQPVTADAAA